MIGPARVRSQAWRLHSRSRKSPLRDHLCKKYLPKLDNKATVEILQAKSDFRNCLESPNSHCKDDKTGAHREEATSSRPTRWIRASPETVTYILWLLLSTRFSPLIPLESLLLGLLSHFKIPHLSLWGENTLQIQKTVLPFPQSLPNRTTKSNTPMS